MRARPIIHPFFDEPTNTVTYIVADPTTKQAAVSDPVLDYDPNAGAVDTRSVHSVVQFAGQQGYVIAWTLETHAHADHLSGSPYIKAKTPLLGFQLGAVVPADARLMSGAVMIDQSMLTGESVPVDASPGDAVYAGSLVRRGQAIVEIIATGSRTYFGRAAEMVRIAHAASTEQAAIFAVTRNLALVNATWRLPSLRTLMRWRLPGKAIALRRRSMVF
jgi:glyoxylase-like metal-dependent hydrolase (beta-lactamase superfamily II)